MIQAAHALLAPIVAPALLIWSHQDAPRPPLPYCSLHVERTTDPAFAVATPPDDDGVSSVSLHREHHVELSCYGPGAVDLARRVAFALKRETHIQRATVLDVAVSTMRPVMSVPALLDKSRYEERGVLEFSLYQLATITEQVGVIEQAPIACWPADAPSP